MEIKKHGLFVVLEGGEGSGKTSVALKLFTDLSMEGYFVKYTREPGGIPEAEAIRNIVVNNKLDATTQALLFAAARKLNTDQIVNPYLEQGYIIICDRYTLSSIIYQGIISEGLGIDNCKAIQGLVSIKPDVEFVLNVDAEVGLKRAAEGDREFNYLDSLGIEYHTRINNAYKENYNEARVRFDIDTNRDFDEVYQDVLMKLRKSIRTQFVGNRYIKRAN